MPAVGASAAIELMFTTAPWPRSIMPGSAARVSRSGVKTFSRSSHSPPSTSMAALGSMCCTPALFTSTSTGPSAASAAASQATARAGSLRSAPST